jgi:hypothetical protein
LVTQRKQSPIKALQIAFDSGDNVTAFGGITRVERLARRMGLWEELEKAMDRRRGHYSWLEIIKTAAVGLLTGAQRIEADIILPDFGLTKRRGEQLDTIKVVWRRG